MNDDFDISPLEDRLRRESRDLASSCQRPGSATVLIAEHHRRRRRRIGRMAAAACAAGLILGAAIWPVIRPRPQFTEKPTIVEAPKRLLLEIPVAPPPSAVAQQPPEESSEALTNEPIAFLVTEADGSRVVAVGVYVPPRVEQVDLRDLSPLEQAAVRRVLGLEEEAVKPTI
jgi:hypothetical protein